MKKCLTGRQKIEEKSVQDLIEKEKNKRANTQDLVSLVKRFKGNFEFLIGTGTSKLVGIPTANELIEKWQKKRYIQLNTDKNLSLQRDESKIKLLLNLKIFHLNTREDKTLLKLKNLMDILKYISREY